MINKYKISSTRMTLIQEMKYFLSYCTYTRYSMILIMIEFHQYKKLVKRKLKWKNVGHILSDLNWLWNINSQVSRVNLFLFSHKWFWNLMPEQYIHSVIFKWWIKTLNWIQQKDLFFLLLKNFSPSNLIMNVCCVEFPGM